MVKMKSAALKLLCVLMMLGLLIGCSGEGIFAIVAVAEKIGEGSLPPGLSAGPVLNIAPDPPDTTTANYLFVSSGPALYYKHKNADRWNRLNLISNTGKWDGVQSMVATKKRIFMALYRIGGGRYQVALHTLDSFDGSSATITMLTGSLMASSSSAYRTIRLFCPDASETTHAVYVNVWKYSGTYGERSNFVDSELYALTPDLTDWGRKTRLSGTDTHLNGSTGRYVTGVADRNSNSSSGDNDIRITATSSKFNTSGGLMMNRAGAVKTYGSNVSTTGIVWIRRNWENHNGPGTYIMAGTAGTFPIFASGDGNDWVQVASTSKLITNFIDVSDTTAGSRGDKHLVLAGTTSYTTGNTQTVEAGGYYEIDVTSDTLSDWGVGSGSNFASIINYRSSTLPSTSFLWWARPAGGDYLYASTRKNGLWRIALNKGAPSWSRE